MIHEELNEENDSEELANSMEGQMEKSKLTQHTSGEKTQKSIIKKVLRSKSPETISRRSELSETFQIAELNKSKAIASRRFALLPTSHNACQLSHKRATFGFFDKLIQCDNT